MTKLVHVCTQRVPPNELMAFQPTVRSRGRTRAVMPLGKLWMIGSTLRVRFIGGTRSTASQGARAGAVMDGIRQPGV